MSLSGKESDAGRRGAAVVVVLLVAALAGAVGATQAPLAAGRWEDDGIYLVTSKALAEGRGYRHLQFPGQPYQTKYPPFYPMMLSLIWRAWPAFPENVVAMQVMNGVFAAGAAVMGYWLLRRAWGLSACLAGAGTLLVICLLDWLDMIRMTMSEHMYTGLSLAAMLVTIGPGERVTSEGSGRGQTLRVMVGALLASAACLTRSIGVCLAAALVLHWLLRRRWWSAVATLVICGAAIGGWEVWRQGALAGNAAIPQAAAFAYDLDYRIWAPPDWRFLLRVFCHNAVAVPYWLLYYFWQPPLTMVADALRHLLPDLAFLYGFALLTTGLCVIGLVTFWRLRHAVIHLYLSLYVLLICIWPFDPTRFLIPLLPLLSPAVLVGLQRTGRAVKDRLGQFFEEPGAEPASQTGSVAPTLEKAGLSLGGGVAVLVGVLLVNYLSVAVNSWRSSFESDKTNGRAVVVEMLKKHTWPTAVVATENGAYYYLVTGRQTVPFEPAEDYPAMRYCDDQRVMVFGLAHSPGYFKAFETMLDSRYFDYVRRTGITHVVVPGEEGLYGIFQQFRARRASAFRPVTTVGPYRLYEVRL